MGSGAEGQGRRRPLYGPMEAPEELISPGACRWRGGGESIPGSGHSESETGDRSKGRDVGKRQGWGVGREAKKIAGTPGQGN